MFVWNVDPDLFHLPDFLGGRGIRYYGVIYALALMGGFWLWTRQMLRGGHPKARAERFLTPAVIAVIGGARLGHCLFYEPARYLADPITILYFWQGGLASHGTVVGLFVLFFWFSRKEKMPVREVVDRIAFAVAWAAILVRLGNFMNSEIVGRKTGADWGVKFPRYHGDRSLLSISDQCGQVSTQIADKINGVCYDFTNIPLRHPSQLYEAGMGVLMFLLLWIVDRKLGEKRPLGLLGSMFLCIYFIERFLVEYFKEFQTLQDSSSLTMGQILSIPLILLGAFGIYVSLKRKDPAGPIARGEAPAA